MTAISFTVQGERPDFRLMIAFLWSDLHPTDADGDARSPAARDWTELYLKNRERPTEVIEVLPASTKPLVLTVYAEQAALAAQGAYFLARETGSDVVTINGSKDVPITDLVALMGVDFDLPAALQRAADSIWRKATIENPYPHRR